MVKSTVARIFKVVLFVINIIFWLLGCALLGVGIYSEIERNSNEKVAIIGSTSSYAPIALIIVGVIVFIIGFSGCCGAIKEHRGLLIVYAVLIGVIFVLEIAAGVYGYVERNKLQDTVQSGMLTTLDKYNPSQLSGGDSQSWNEVQSKVKCCGVLNYTDWHNATLWIDAVANRTDLRTDVYPSSCCSNATMVSGISFTVCTVGSDDVFYNEGCYDNILSYLRSYWKVLAGVAIGVAVFELLVIVMACVLQGAIKKDEYTAV